MHMEVDICLYSLGVRIYTYVHARMSNYSCLI
jgi:hypothetical protein